MTSENAAILTKDSVFNQLMAENVEENIARSIVKSFDTPEESLAYYENARTKLLDNCREKLRGEAWIAETVTILQNSSRSAKTDIRNIFDQYILNESGVPAALMEFAAAYSPHADYVTEQYQHHVAEPCNYYTEMVKSVTGKFFTEATPAAGNMEYDFNYGSDYIRNIGAVSAAFTESDIVIPLNESADLSVIKEVTAKDVRSKHFVGWYFKMPDWANTTPKKYPFSMITNCDAHSVYGYYIDDKLDGIIRVDDEGESYYLSFFFVNKAVQNHGIGQYLFQYVINKFGYKTLTLSVYTDNKNAIHIYKKYGFKPVRIYYGAGYRPEAPHYIMRRTPDIRHYKSKLVCDKGG